ncbi:MAG: hypothetical protein ABSD92_12760 [Candidatus Bathyarchaeia archaeon]|jgi:hypothetical protein
MASHSTINKSLVILICVLIIGSLVEISAYYYVQNFTSFPSSQVVAQFQLGNLTINPNQASVGQPITVSAGVVNVGDVQGSYSMSFKVNGSVVETKEFALSANESQVVKFSVTEPSEGVYNVTVGNLVGIFSVSSKPLPMPTTLSVANMVNPFEAWPGQLVNVSVDVSNTGTTNISYALPFFVNGVAAQSVQVQLSGGASETITTAFNETSNETYVVSAGGQNSQFTIVPVGYYTLNYFSSYDGLPFTLDGTAEVCPFSGLVAIGQHTISVPASAQIEEAGHGTVTWAFNSWDDGSTELSKTVNVQAETSVETNYHWTGSCPSLFAWDGTGYSYVSDVNDGTGWLGYLEYFKPDGSMVFSYNYPYDYIKLDSTQLQPVNGFYNFKITEMSDEIFYLDSAQMIAVDHPANVNVFSTASTFIYSLSGQGTIYTVSDKPATPVSAVNGTGQNVLPLISTLDGNFTTGTTWSWQSLTLNLGNLTGAKEINMVVAAKIVWPTTQAGGENFLSYANQPGVIPSPPPYMQVIAPNGTWVNVPDDREFPIPHTTDSEFDVNLTGLFLTNNYELKINYYQNIQFDYIGISTTPQQNIIVNTLPLSSASLEQAFTVYNLTCPGAFTKYGDVTPLLQSADNQFVIGREGDSVSLQFSATDLPPVPAGWVRDYFIIANCWFKGLGLSYVPFTVDPLPFQAMTSFPYPSNETYPYTAVNLAYLKEYDTRIINSP